MLVNWHQWLICDKTNSGTCLVVWTTRLRPNNLDFRSQKQHCTMYSKRFMCSWMCCSTLNSEISLHLIVAMLHWHVVISFGNILIMDNHTFRILRFHLHHSIKSMWLWKLKHYYDHPPINTFVGAQHRSVFRCNEQSENADLHRCESGVLIRNSKISGCLSCPKLIYDKIFIRSNYFFQK